MVVKNTDQDTNEGLLGIMLVAISEDDKDETVTLGNFSVSNFHNLEP